MTRTSLVSALAITAILATSVVATAAGNGPGGKGHDEMRGQRGGAGFEMMDTNADGSVTKDEIAAEAQKRFTEADTDGDGKLSAEEIVAQADSQAAKMRAERMQKRVEAMLKQRDTDGDGMLSPAEMQDTDRSARFFDRFDTDKDGTVTQAEFDAAREKFREARADRHEKRMHKGDKHGDKRGHKHDDKRGDMQNGGEGDN